jgi:heat shock protein HslJ
MKNHIIRHFLLFSVFILIVSGTAPADARNRFERSPEIVTETFEVGDQRVYCEGVVPKKCLLVKRKDQVDFFRFYDEIENFTFEPGYRYTLEVDVEKIPEPPKDTSGYKYTLKEVVKREQTDIQPEAANLFRSKWILTKINGAEIETERAFLVFNKTVDSFYGNTGCNSMSGQYELRDDTIRIGDVSQTKRACPEMQSVESPFMSIAAEKNRLQVTSDKLLFLKDGVAVLEFRSNWNE